MPILPWRDTLTVHALEGGEALDYLAVQWPMLYARDQEATPYQSSAWLRGWAAQRPATTPIVLAASYGPGRPAAALALAREHNAQGRARVSPLGSPFAEYVRAVGPDASQPHVAAALVRRLVEWAEEGVSVVLPDVPSASCLGRIVAAEPGWQHTTVLCARIQLPVSYDAMSRSTRREHTRRERIWTDLAAAGRIEYHRTRTREELASGYSDAQHLHRRRWAGHPASPDVDLDGLLEVLRRCGPGEVFVATLRLDGVAVAAMVCLYRERTCYSLLPAMDPAVAGLAPGHALQRRLLSDLARLEFDSLDLGRTRSDPGQVEYKRQYGPRWTTTTTAASAGSW
ncbi:GNAT family N-acetyltransferase [Streptomyces lydicus]|uniref:GNAT family N-acetyltransferase n=1 Tax=Streptomyces lydicus TaxID=47763 RepID=UPI0013E903A1|nr:GNAT family N-acetyltransferase [Streptomyces lydicus]MCZ1012077.1 GNAT family N-acetyltransferase [Streptomyces lydicus]